MHESKSAYERAVEYNKEQITKSKAWGMSLGQTVSEFYWELAEEHRLPYLEGILSNARKDKWGYEACATIAARFLHDGCALPEPLATWAADVLEERKSKPSTGAKTTGGRDMIIGMLLMVNVTEFRLNLDRNDGDEPFSAIDAVAEAAELKPFTVQNIAYNKEKVPQMARDHWRTVKNARTLSP